MIRRAEKKKHTKPKFTTVKTLLLREDILISKVKVEQLVLKKLLNNPCNPAQIKIIRLKLKNLKNRHNILEKSKIRKILGEEDLDVSIIKPAIKANRLNICADLGIKNKRIKMCTHCGQNLKTHKFCRRGRFLFECRKILTDLDSYNYEVCPTCEKCTKFPYEKICSNCHMQYKWNCANVYKYIKREL